MPSDFCPYFTVGLTGGIASGKSTVSQLWGSWGARIVDTDVIAHQLTAPNGIALPAITDAFGAAMLQANGALDRMAMRQCVFKDAKARSKLEAILHPLIFEYAYASANQPLSQDEHYVVVVVPLLVKPDGDASTWRNAVDRIAVVDCSPTDQIARLQLRAGISLDQAHAILNTQSTRAQRLQHADDVLDNTRDAVFLEQQTLYLHQVYMQQAHMNANTSVKLT